MDGPHRDFINRDKLPTFTYGKCKDCGELLETFRKDGRHGNCMGHKCCGRKKACDSEPTNSNLIGMKMGDVPSSVNVRASVVDGQPQIGTCDFVPSRVNVAVENGVIVSIVGMG
jgi:hypothetical protein